MKKKIMFTFTLVLVFVINLNAQMRVHLINVGQGCATLIEFPCAAILIDAGGEKNGLYNSTEALKTYLDDFFERRTDLNHTLQCVYLTHPHKDHTLGVPILLDSPFVIKNAVTDGLERGSGKAGQIKLHRAAQDAEVNTDPADNIGFEPVTTDKIGSQGFTNDTIDAVNCSGTNPVIRVLWGTSISQPPGWNKDAFDNENNHSLVIKVEYGASSILITGDLEDIAQRSLMAKYSGTNVLDADVYVVGHHGSKNGSLFELIKKMSPKMALIGVGDPNRQVSWTAWAYGHPNKLILDSLQQKLSSFRTPPTQVQAGTGAKKFVPFTVKKAIYATGWDDNVILQADNTGQWKKIEEGSAEMETGMAVNVVPNLVNLNTATAAQLETLPGIGPTRAQAIVEFRTSHGNFTTIEQLDDVPGIGPSTIKLVKPYVTL